MAYNTTKWAIIDVESSGLDRYKNGIYQISGRLIDRGDIGSPDENFNITSCLFATDLFSENALLFDNKPLTEVIGVDPGSELSYNYLVNAFRDNFDRLTFKAGGKTVEEILSYQNAEEAHAELISILDRWINKYDKKDKFWFFAYNSPFDNGMLRSFFDKCGNKFFGSYFQTPDICIMRMAGQFFANEGYRPENFKLESVARAFDIEVDPSQLHDAAYDINLTHKVLEELMRRKSIY